jgi:hypothetical protein
MLFKVCVLNCQFFGLWCSKFLTTFAANSIILFCMIAALEPDDYLVFAKLFGGHQDASK